MHHAAAMDEMIERPFWQTAIAFLNDFPSIDDHVDAPQLKDQILAVVAHELRGPLSPLRLASHLIRTASADRPEVLRSIDMIDRQITQIARLADDLMDATRAGQRTLRVHRTCVDLADVLADPFEAAALAAAQRGQTLTLQVLDRTLCINCDPVRLAQAIHNLLHNAVKYTPTDGRITVTARAEGKDLVVSVKDNGLGISGELLPHVFDLFAQSSRTIAASAGGLGVGLAVVKAIAEAHGGTASATSAGPGTGSEFTLRLPIITKQRADCDRA